MVPSSLIYRVGPQVMIFNSCTNHISPSWWILNIFSSKTNFTNHLILKSSNQLMVYINKSHDKSTFKLVCWLRLCGIMKILMHNSYFPLIPYFECYFLYLILYHYMIFEWKYTDLNWLELNWNTGLFDFKCKQLKMEIK